MYSVFVSPLQNKKKIIDVNIYKILCNGI